MRQLYCELEFLKEFLDSKPFSENRMRVSNSCGHIQTNGQKTGLQDDNAQRAVFTSEERESVKERQENKFVSFIKGCIDSWRSAYRPDVHNGSSTAGINDNSIAGQNSPVTATSHINMSVRDWLAFWDYLLHTPKVFDCNNKPELFRFIEDNPDTFPYFEQMLRENGYAEAPITLDTSHFHDTEETENEVSEEVMSSVFLLEDSSPVFPKKGIISIVPENISVMSPYFKTNTVSLLRNKNGSWETILSNSGHKFNSMLIMDKYLCTNMDENLGKILNSLLPGSGDSVQISIFTDNDQLNFVKNYLQTYLNYYKGGNKLIFEVFGCFGNQLHHRVIMTNNLRINSDAGFDLFKRAPNGKSMTVKEAEINISMPYFTPSEPGKIQAYEDDIKTAKNILRTTGQTSGNRLLQ